MDKKNRITEICRRLTVSRGACTNEKELLLTIRKEFCDDVETYFDGMGNLIAVRKSQTALKKLVVAVSVDCPCLIATHIDNDGKIRVQKLGTTDVGAWRYGKVVFENGAKGVVRAIDHSEKPESFDGIYIDIGADDKQGALKIVSQGETVLPDRNSTGAIKISPEGEICGYGAAAIFKAALAVDLANTLSVPETDVYVAFCVQGQLNSRGMESVLSGVRPEIAVCIDVCADIECPTVAVREKSGIYSESVTEELCQRLGVPEKAALKAFDEGVDCGLILRSGALGGKVYLPAKGIGTVNESVLLADWVDG